MTFATVEIDKYLVRVLRNMRPRPPLALGIGSRRHGKLLFTGLLSAPPPACGQGRGGIGQGLLRRGTPYKNAHGLAVPNPHFTLFGLSLSARASNSCL
jgi:hypothetical protein